MRLQYILAILVILDHSIVFRVSIPEVVLIQLPYWGWVQSCSKHAEDSTKHTIEENVCQVGHLPELYEDARSEKYKILSTSCLNNNLVHTEKLTIQNSSFREHL
jgi:hypothetical protein